MAWIRFRSLSILALAIIGFVASGPNLVHGQITGAGVVVDASGVLRTKIYRDPTGHLTKMRMAEARAKLGADVMKPSKLRKVSLNRLEAALASRLAEGQIETEEMKYLAGLTEISHVFFYPETGDIVIAGPAEGFFQNAAGRTISMVSGKATLQLQDMIAALRAFSSNGEQAKVIGCSIDPTQEGLQRMREYLQRISGQVRPGDASRIAAGLKENLGLQTVSIKGVSPRTHFAQVLVEADYRMKLIGIGLESPMANIPSYVSKANPTAVSRNALQRWFFTPDYECVKVSEDDLAMELIGNGVKLISEDEKVASDGSRIRSTTKDRASMAFATAFTKQYDRLASTTPVYGQLKNLIDMTIVAAFIQSQDYYGKADWDMAIFSDESTFPIETYETPQQVETAVNAVWRGNRLMTPVGGGVNIQAMQAMHGNNLSYDERGTVAKVRAEASIDGLQAGQWWWD